MMEMSHLQLTEKTQNRLLFAWFIFSHFLHSHLLLYLLNFLTRGTKRHHLSDSPVLGTLQYK